MARRPAPPKPEELIAKLEEKFESFKQEITGSVDEHSKEIAQINENEKTIDEKLDSNNSAQTATLENAQSEIEKIIEEKINDLKDEFLRNMQEMSEKIDKTSSSNSGTEEQIQELIDRVENIQEKMYDFEVNKRNNLLFYGIKGSVKESQGDLYKKVFKGD